MSNPVRENATIVLDIQKQLVDDRLILGESPVGRYVQEGMSNQHQMPEARQIKEEHDQQPNLIQQLEISLQELNMNFNQLAGHKNSEYALLLEPMSDHSMEELLNSVYLNLRGKWRHSYKMTGNTPSMSKWSTS